MRGPDRLDPAWSRHLSVPSHDGSVHQWHLLDSGPARGSSGTADGTADDTAVGTLLCVHGNPTWSYLWRALVADPPAGWRVVAPDQLGMGWSERLATPRTFAERVRDLGDLTRELGLDGPMVSVGHDWGGAISLGWALDHREQLRAMVLTNTAVAQPHGDRGPLLIRLAHLRALRTWACVRTPMFVAATSRISVPPLARAVRRELAKPYRTAERRRAVGDFVADIPFAGNHPSGPDVAAVAEGITTLQVPTLMMWGPRDPVFGERYLDDLRRRMPHAQVHRYEGAGHLVTEDAPQYADTVRAWVAQLDRPGSSVPDPSRTDPETPPGPPGARRLWSALDARSSDTSPAVVDLGGSTLSWAELSRRVDDVAAGLRAAGLQSGDRVGVLVEPSIELTVAAYAVWRAGGVLVVADKGLGLTGFRRALRGASLAWVIGGGTGLAAAQAMGLPGRRIHVERQARLRFGAEHNLAGLAHLGRHRLTDAGPTPEPPLDAELAVLFTSGATGPAKGVVYRHRQAAAQLDLVCATYGLADTDRLVAAFAPFALFGPALGVASVVPDIDVTTPGSLTATALAQAVEALDATVVFAAPAALRQVVATADALTDRHRTALGAVRLLMSAGAPVPPRLLDQVQRVLPAAELHTPYGMTEVLPVTDISAAEIKAAELAAAGTEGGGVCVGLPLPGVDVAIAPMLDDGSVDGAPLARPGVLGEICVHAAHVKDRYDGLWATEHASSRNVGWHRTGDVGRLDDTGRLWVEGRLGHVVTTPRTVVTPVPVEQRIEALTGVEAAAAVGVGPAGTQAVVVVVVPTAPAQRRLTPAPLGLAESVRSAAGVPVAAVLVTRALPVDVRHQSKVDRLEVARRAALLLQ